MQFLAIFVKNVSHQLIPVVKPWITEWSEPHYNYNAVLYRPIVNYNKLNLLDTKINLITSSYLIFLKYGIYKSPGISQIFVAFHLLFQNFQDGFSMPGFFQVFQSW